MSTTPERPLVYTTPAPRLLVGRYRFTLVAQRSMTLRPYLGITLRGGLGHVLRRTVCVTRMPACDPCLLRHSCAFPVLFQPYAPPGHPERSRYTRMPPPFVLRVPFDATPFLKGHPLSPYTLQEGESLTFDLTLVGQANGHLPYYIYAVMQLAARGIGHRDHTFFLRDVLALVDGQVTPLYHASTNTLSPPSSLPPLQHYLDTHPVLDGHTVRIRFVTPVRLDLDGDLIYPIEFHHLMRGLVQRWQALEACYGVIHPRVQREDLMRLLDLAQDVQTSSIHTRWLDLNRYSTRQKARLQLGGAVGEVVYTSKATFAPFTPLLAFGVHMHVGKLTGMGFGHMEVDM